MANKRKFLSSLASTAKEWHYLVAGFTTGVSVGMYVAMRVLTE